MTTESQLRGVLLDLVTGTKGFSAIPVTGGSVPPVDPIINSYTTSSTPNSWTQALAANTSRKILFIQNPPTNTANVDIGFGGSGSEALAFTLEPGSGASIVNQPISSRISARSSSASVPVTIWEA